LDDKNYDTKVSATKTNYDGDGFCGVTSKNYPEINDVKQWVISLNLALARLRLEG
jgi:hypothetical protein